MKESKVMLKYGWRDFTPEFFQFLNTAFYFTVFVSISNFINNSMVSGILGVIVSTLEKRFELSSLQSSWISNVTEISGYAMAIGFSIIGSRCHRPRWISGMLVLCSLSCFLFVVPHFTTSIYRPPASLQMDNGLCNSSRSIDRCSTDKNAGKEHVESGLQNYLVIFIISRLLAGIGVAPFGTIVITHLDGITTKEQFSLYLGMFHGIGTFGSSVAFVLGGFFLSFYTDALTTDAENVGLTQDDPRWVGAWWPTLLIGGFLFFIFSLPLFGYARDIPGSKTIRIANISEAHGGLSEKETHEEDNEGVDSLPLSESLHDLFVNLGGLLINPTYMMLIFYTSFDFLIISCFTSYGPKFVETQFGVSPSIAGMIFGIATIPGGVGGYIVGGWVIQRFRLRVPAILRCVVLTALISTVGLTGLFLRCSPIQFAGINAPYNNSNSAAPFNLSDTCNTRCNCDSIAYDPVCSDDTNKTIRFYSPCHAGCNNEQLTNPKTYSNCSCVNAGNDNIRTVSRECPNSACPSLILFAILFLIVLFCLYMSQSLCGTLFIRTIKKKERYAAFCISGLIFKVLGTIPGPLVMGAAFDASCNLWKYTCKTRGNCLNYDNQSLSLYIFQICFSVKSIGAILSILSTILYRPPKIQNSQTTKDVYVQELVNTHL